MALRGETRYLASLNRWWQLSSANQTWEEGTCCACAAKALYIRPCFCGKIPGDCARSSNLLPSCCSAQHSLKLSLRPTVTATGQEGKCRVCPTRTSQHARGTVDRSGQWTGQDRAPAVLRQTEAVISLIKSGGGASLVLGEMKRTVCLCVLG